jgi:hypothetical protein
MMDGHQTVVYLTLADLVAACIANYPPEPR